jgi:hypothetical protein
MYLTGCLPYQKNGNVVRQVVGYDRFTGELAYRQLAELYRALRVYVNCFQPSMKLQTKERDGSKVRRIYDQAQTPMQRLLASLVLAPKKQHELLRITEAMDPLLAHAARTPPESAVAACSQARNHLCHAGTRFHTQVFGRERVGGKAAC